ncbi:alkaline phosphatase D family protein [Bacillus sp. T33-2]|uniref:alkaline phosphatase D family protein n=1 Tax=Bacillus sp. T33-2 TaxID=2054168 RepID=UPI002155467F|nr:alkaline phosphatase D family protein [Bacillus sp. T33-2]
MFTYPARTIRTAIFGELSHMADENMDFFLHVGDYIYESVGDASYQGGLKDRTITLDHTARREKQSVYR